MLYQRPETIKKFLGRLLATPLPDHRTKLRLEFERPTAVVAATEVPRDSRSAEHRHLFIEVVVDVFDCVVAYLAH